MRKVKTIKIDDREYTVKELTVRQVWQLVNNETPTGSADSDDMSGAVARVESFLSMSCPELTREVSLDLAPSELATLWEVFAEVNADFLAMARKVGIDTVLVNAAKEAVETSIGQYSA